MGKKRKSLATTLDEVDRTMYSAFTSAANSLSHLYTQAMHHQKLTFQAGERHGLEKLHQWLLRQQEGGSRLNTIDILSYLQTELECHGEEPSMSNRGGGAHQNPNANSNSNSQPTTNIINVAGQGGEGFSISSVGAWMPAEAVQSFPSKQQNNQQSNKNLVFSNALSSPVGRSLQSYHHHHHHIDQGGFYPPKWVQE